MNTLEILEQRNLCVNDEPPYCENDCPLGIAVRDVAEKVGEGDFAGAAKLLQKKSPFARTLSWICPQPCRESCLRAEHGGAVEVRALERACFAYGGSTRTAPHFSSSKKTGTVAIVGGGIAGLACAYSLSGKGYDVHVYEKGDRLGGMLRSLSPAALPPDVLDADIAEAVRKAHVHLNTEIADLADCEWDACLVATGAGGATFDLETEGGFVVIEDAIAGSTSRESVFAAGGVCGIRAVVAQVADGLRVARTIERCLKGASLSLGREDEAYRKTCLYVDASDVVSVGPVAIPDEGYTREAAIEEAARCLRCTCGACARTCSLMTDMKQLPKRCISDIGKTLGAITQLSAKVNTRVINSCDQCGLCIEKCPTGLNMGALFMEARQTLHERGDLPPAFHDFFLRDMEFANGPRAACTVVPAETVDYLFFPGCQLGASNPQYVTRSFAYLRDVLGADAVGLKTGCCGAPAQWAGAHDEFEAQVARFHDEWEQLGKPQVVLACPTCAKMFRRACADLPIVSLWEVMREHGLPVGVAGRFEGVTVDLFDPCASRYDEASQDAVRWTLSQVGFDFVELSKREEARCCGYGGLIYGANPRLAEKMVDERLAASQHAVVTYCSNCRDVFAAKGKTAFHLLDLVFDLGFPQERGTVSLGDRRTNREIVRCDALGIAYEPKPDEGMVVICPPSVIEKMNAQLLLFEEVKAAIDHGEEFSEKLYDPERGVYITHLKTGLVTCWVEYTVEGRTASVSNVYSHRMTVLK